jgi:hypothetical protein
MKEVRKHVDAGTIKKAWAYKYTGMNDTVEFHCGDFYWHGRGCCLWYAKAQGWEAYLEHIGKGGDSENA